MYTIGLLGRIDNNIICIIILLFLLLHNHLICTYLLFIDLLHKHLLFNKNVICN